MSNTKENLQIIAGYILICLLWGSTWMFIKLGLGSVTPFFSVGARFLLASGFIYITMRMMGVKFATDAASIKLYLFVGIFSFTLPFTLVYWGEQFLSSGLTSILFAVFPFWVIIFSFFLIKDQKVKLSQVLGIAIGFAGILVIFSESLDFNVENGFWAMAAVLVSAMTQGMVSVVLKKHAAKINPVSLNFVPTLLTGVLMLVLSFATEDFADQTIDQNAVISIVYLALFGTVFTFTTYYWLLKKINVVIISLSTFITPIVALVLGWIFLNEVLSTDDFMGSALVLTGILITNVPGIRNYIKQKKNG